VLTFMGISVSLKDPFCLSHEFGTASPVLWYFACKLRCF
jgi:hypothetical protein